MVVDTTRTHVMRILLRAALVKKGAKLIEQVDDHHMQNIATREWGIQRTHKDVYEKKMYRAKSTDERKHERQKQRIKIDYRPFDNRRDIQFRGPLCGFIRDFDTGATYSSKKIGVYSSKGKSSQLEAERIDRMFLEESSKFCDSIQIDELHSVLNESFDLARAIACEKEKYLRSSQKKLTSDYISNLTDWVFFESRVNFVEFGTYVCQTFPELWDRSPYFLQRELQWIMFPRGIFHVWSEDRLLFPYNLFTPFK